MQTWKRWTASILAVLMLAAAWPITALAEGTERADVVTFNLSDQEVTVGAQEAEGVMDHFAANGSYTIELEDDAFFPYEVQFTCGGKTWQEWFMTPEDSVEVGGHTFTVSSQRTDPTALTQLGIWVGDTYVAAWPEEKTFTNDGPQASTTSMMPLEYRYLSMDMTGFFPEELRNISIATVNDKLTGNDGKGVAAWAKFYYYDENGNYVSENDSFTVVGEDATIDLSSYSSYTSSLSLELIVGTADQLDLSNLRYRVTIRLPSVSQLLELTAYSEDRSREIPVYDTYYGQGWSEDGRDVYEFGVDKTAWQRGEKAYLSMSLNSAFTDVTATVYEGYYETEDAIPEDAKDITGQIWDQSDLADQGGYLQDYSWKEDYQGMPEVTVVLKRGGQTVRVLPVILCMYEEGMYLSRSNSLYAEEDGSRKNVWYGYSYGYEYVTVTLKGGYPADGTYYFGLYMYDPAGNASDDPYGLQNVKKAVVGDYSSEADIPADAVDIKEQLFSNAASSGGYGADYSNGVTFTVVDVNGDIHWFDLKVVADDGEGEDDPLPEVPRPASADTYFRMQGAYDAQDEYIYAYVMPYDADGYYYNGYQTVLLLNRKWNSESRAYEYTPVTDEQIKPTFYTGNKVQMFAGSDGNSGTKQESGETAVTFQSGQVIPYSAAAENGTNLKNYWVTFLTQQSGPSLFVNATNDKSHYVEVSVTDEKTGETTTTKLPQREVSLTADFNYQHDVFFANVGDEAIEGLYVKLENAENVALDEYWTVGQTTTLSAFTTTSREKSYGELANVAKIRLVPMTDEDGNMLVGDISGTLVIGYTGGEGQTGEEVRIQLTGVAGIPEITTSRIVDGVKYVPYSSMIQTNNMYGSDRITFEITEGTLPSGVILKPNGELYGVPQAAGSFDFTVQMSYDGKAADTATYTLTILDNTNENVWNATDSSYEVLDYVGERTGNAKFELKAYDDTVFRTAGAFAYFVDFWLDGEKLIAGEDYSAEEGSTKITIFAQTLRNAGSGTHTIAAEFREGSKTDGALKRAAQNYKVEGLDTPVPYPVAKPGSSTTTTTKPAEKSELPFTDVADKAWFYGDVKWAYENSYMVGIADTLFGPANWIDQPTVVTVLARMAKVDLEQFNGVTYDSITPGRWYTNAVIWAKQAGMLPDNTDFVEDGGFTRGQMAIMLVKYLYSMGIDTSLPSPLAVFEDAAQMTQAENDAFQVLYHYGIFRGVGGSRMNVSGTVTRAEFSALIHRISVFVAEQK